MWVAIIATDLAEVIGSAIGINLIFRVPLIWGILITSADVILLLFLWNSKTYHFFELGVTLLVLAVGLCFVFLLTYTKPDWGAVGLGYLPSAELFTRPNMLFVAIGIIGATVMPHNLYLHSNLILYRSSINQVTIGEPSCTELKNLSEQETYKFQPLRRQKFLPALIRLGALDSTCSLTLALLINSLILIVSAAAFGSLGIEVNDLIGAHNLLVTNVGSVAGLLFAIALLCSGQSSTITGTMAGQIVMEGFLGSKLKRVIRPWMRRILTRICSIVPALIVLPFAVWPLVYFTSRKYYMTVEFKRDEFDGPDAIALQSMNTVLPDVNQDLDNLSTNTAEELVINSVDNLEEASN
ncbi:hypothetical protein HK096_005627, partial [Nowakowskiella sp. JEL0078]